MAYLKKHKTTIHEGFKYSGNQCEMSVSGNNTEESKKQQECSLIVFSILAGMEQPIPFWPEWNSPFHSGRNEMVHSIPAGMECNHFILARMKWTILAGMEWSFHSGRNEMPFFA